MAAYLELRCTPQDVQAALEPIAQADFEIIQKAIQLNNELRALITAEQLPNKRLFIRVNAAVIDHPKIENLVARMEMGAPTPAKALELKKRIVLSIESRNVAKKELGGAQPAAKGKN